MNKTSISFLESLFAILGAVNSRYIILVARCTSRFLSTNFSFNFLRQLQLSLFGIFAFGGVTTLEAQVVSSPTISGAVPPYVFYNTFRPQVNLKVDFTVAGFPPRSQFGMFSSVLEFSGAQPISSTVVNPTGPGSGIFSLAPGVYDLSVFVSETNDSATVIAAAQSPSIHITVLGITLLDLNDGSGIPLGGTAWITPGSAAAPPQMPKLQASATGPSLTDTMHWNLYALDGHRIDVSGSATNFQQTDAEVIIPSGEATSTRDLAVSNPWNIYNEPGPHAPTMASFFGGDSVSLGYQFDKGASGTFSFSILGFNPKAADIISYISSHAPGYRYATWIIDWESKFQQFNQTQSDYSGDLDGEPNWGSPDGWGLGQVDGNGSKRTITSDEIWNWQTNLNSSFQVMQQKRKAAAQYFTSVQLWCALNGRTYVPPPATTIVESAFLDANNNVPTTHTPITFLEAAEITLYNGATVIHTLPVGKPLKGQAQQTAPQVSCWDFDINNLNTHTSLVWTLVQETSGNQNDYLYNVIHRAEHDALVP